MNGRMLRAGFAALACLLSSAHLAAAAGGSALAWPAPPDVARIRYVDCYRSTNDLGGGFFGRVFDFLVGGQAHPGLYQPMGVAVSEDGQRVYVSDYAVSAVFVFDFAANEARFLGLGRDQAAKPLGLALGPGETCYVTDTVHNVVKVYDRQGTLLRSFGQKDVERPTGIAVDASRNRVYVCDSSSNESNHHGVVVFDLQGKKVASWCKKGAGRGEFAWPAYLALDPDGNLYVSDTMNARIQVLSPGGDVLKIIGERGDTPGSFDKPKGLAFDRRGNLYVADAIYSSIQIFNPKGEVLMFFPDGRSKATGYLNNPTGIAIDARNRIYVCDSLNHRLNVYELLPDPSASAAQR